MFGQVTDQALDIESGDTASRYEGDVQPPDTRYEADVFGDFLDESTEHDFVQACAGRKILNGWRGSLCLVSTEHRLYSTVDLRFYIAKLADNSRDGQSCLGHANVSQRIGWAIRINASCPICCGRRHVFSCASDGCFPVSSNLICRDRVRAACGLLQLGTISQLRRC